jgi:uncharacterized protein
MKILIDIGHPAHVHIFKHFAWTMENKGHEVYFTLRDKEHEIYLLSKYGFKYKCFGKNYKTKTAKIIGLVLFDFKLFFVALRFRPDLFLSHGSMYAAHVAWILGKPHISLEDSGNMEQIRLYAPFTQCILTPDFLPNNLGNKQIRYKANHELFYLNPTYFTPSDSIFQFLKIPNGSRFAILRFVSWAASHDYGQAGLKPEDKIMLVKYLVQQGIYVYISAERHKLPKELEEYTINIPPDLMHDALAFSTIYIGEGATMASEAGVLGTPSLYISSIVRYYNVDQERFNLVFNFINIAGVMDRVKEIIENNSDKLIYKQNQKKFLAEKINPTPFFIWFIENYPYSFNKIKEDPDYQFKFL